MTHRSFLHEYSETKMGFNEQYSKRTNSALSVTDDQFESELKNEYKCLHDVYIAYCKALRARKFKRIDVINFWLAGKEEEDHEFSIKKHTFKSNEIKQQ